MQNENEMFRSAKNNTNRGIGANSQEGGWVEMVNEWIGYSTYSYTNG